MTSPGITPNTPSRATSSPSVSAASTAAPAPLGRRVFPILALLGYITFLITGFGTGMGTWRPLPVYIFFGFLLFVLMANVAPTRGVGAFLYTAFASVFALVFAGDVVFNASSRLHFTRAPLTYIIVNFLLFAVLIIDVIRRRPDLAQRMGMGGTRAAADAEIARRHPFSPATLAIDFAELALLAYVAATLVNLLAVGKHPYVIVDLNQTFGWQLPTRIHLLQDFDSAIALAATALTLLFLGIVSGVPSSEDRKTAAERTTTRGTQISSFETALGRIFRTSFREVLYSLQLVLGPLIFVSVGLCLAYLSQQIALYFQSSQSSTNVFDLLNPFSPNSTARYAQGLLTVLLALLAVASFLVSVAIVNHDLRVIRRTLGLIGSAGQTAALSLAFFMFSLAFLNAVLVFIGVTRLEPFQVSAFALLALLVGGAFAVYPSMRANVASPASASTGRRSA